jgi:hypothetical protein
MPNNIFSKDLSNNILIDFLKIYCPLENDYYILNKLIYKKYEYNNLLYDFINYLQDYYKISKQFYIDRNITYNNLLTIIRQICKYNNIAYYSKIKYDKNKYYIIYYIKNIKN